MGDAEGEGDLEGEGEGDLEGDGLGVVLPPSAVYGKNGLPRPVEPSKTGISLKSSWPDSNGSFRALRLMSIVLSGTTTGGRLLPSLMTPNQKMAPASTMMTTKSGTNSCCLFSSSKKTIAMAQN